MANPAEETATASGASWLGLIEFGVVAMFALGWAVLELYCLQLDKKKAARQAESERLENANRQD